MVDEGLRMKDGGWRISTLIILTTLITRMTLITPMALMQRPEKITQGHATVCRLKVRENGKMENWKIGKIDKSINR